MKRVAILGGGPAGAFAAERLASAGLRVAVFDEKLAWEKPCGGGLTYKAYSQYPFLIDNPTPKRLVHETVLGAPGGGEACLKLTDPMVIYSRFDLNRMLLERAERAGGGLGLTMMPVTAAAYFGLTHAEIPKASTTMNIVRQVGGSVATALFAVVLERQIVTQLGPASEAVEHRRHPSTAVRPATGRRPGRRGRSCTRSGGPSERSCSPSSRPCSCPTTPRRRAHPRPMGTATPRASTGRPSPGPCSTDGTTRPPPGRSSRRQLSRAGCVAAEEEARAELRVCRWGPLKSCAGPGRPTPVPASPWPGSPDTRRLRRPVDPGSLHPGVYVPRWQSVDLARGPAPASPTTGSHRPVHRDGGRGRRLPGDARPARAASWRTDNDSRAVACVWANGVEAFGATCSPRAGLVPRHDRRCGRRGALRPSTELHLLPRDTLRFEDASHYDGGPDGTDLLRRVVTGVRTLPASRRCAVPGTGRGTGRVTPSHARPARVRAVRTWSDEDGDLRGLEATYELRQRRPARRRRFSAVRRPGPPLSDPPRASARSWSR